MVLQKREIVPEIVTAGLDTVAVRISAHPVFAEIVCELDQPLAAPSANRFGRVSPTTAQHVLDELDGRIPLIIDGGPAEHGIESTVVAVRGGKIDILRRGPITAEQLSEFGKIDIVTAKPEDFRAGTITLALLAEDAVASDRQCRIIFAARKPARRLASVESGGTGEEIRGSSPLKREARPSRSSRESVSLFARARCDPLSILSLRNEFPARGLGAAILDRLERASHDQSVVPDMPE